MARLAPARDREDPLVRLAGTALLFADPSAQLRPAVINGRAGVLVVRDGKPFSVMRFTVLDGRIAAIDVETSPERLRQIAVT